MTTMETGWSSSGEERPRDSFHAMVGPVLTSLTMRRFRSVESACINFDNPTFLVGRNGAGKSNVVDALAFLSDALANPLDIAFDMRGGITAVRNRSVGSGYPPNIGISVSFGKQKLEYGSTMLRATYGFEIKATKNQGFQVVREQCVIEFDTPPKFLPGLPDTKEVKFWFNFQKGSLDSNMSFLKSISRPTFSNNLVLAWFGGLPPFSIVYNILRRLRSYAIDPSELRRPQEPDEGFDLKRDGSNSASVLRHLARTSPKELDRLFEVLGSITPGTHTIRPLRHGRMLTLEFVQKWANDHTLTFEAFNASEGTLRALGVLLALIQRPSAAITIIEEPESSLHPGAVNAILDIIRLAAADKQIILTTHSPDVLDARWIKAENIRLVKWESGSTTVENLPTRSAQALRNYLMTAGELLRSDALEDGSLFAANAIRKRDELFVAV